MKNQSNRKNAGLFLSAVLMLGAFFLSACDLYEESGINQNKIQIEEDRYFEKIPLTALDQGKIDSIGKYYSRYGEGPIVISIVYDPESATDSALQASHEMEKVTKKFRESGLRDLKADILPSSGNADFVLISFVDLRAVAPKDCRTMPGFEKEMERDEDYPLGCTVDTLFARQISRPRDLKGQEQTEATVDGRRTGNTVEFYRDGVPNEPLEGESASDQ